MRVAFHDGDAVLEERRLELAALASIGDQTQFHGWVLAPEHAKRVQLGLPPALLGAAREISLHPVAERDPICHPLAHIPRWSTYRPPFEPQGVLLPSKLESLSDVLRDLSPRVLEPCRSVEALRKQIRGAACILDAAAVERLMLTWDDVAKLVDGAWVVIDLAVAVWLMARSETGPRTMLIDRTSAHELMSAKVEYADVPTRGFALNDVFPYGVLDEEGAFSARVIESRKSWKRWADREGAATLLSSETPWENRCGDILAAAVPVGRGEVIISDAPALVAGQLGKLVAPNLIRHLLRMQLCAPLADGAQYWNRWDDLNIVIRDIADLTRRYRALRAVRWAGPADHIASLGLALAPTRGETKRTLLIRTGSIDFQAATPGVPPEPVLLLMKHFAREADEGTSWARKHLADTTLIWQFDTAAGQKYALHFESAAGAGGGGLHTLEIEATDRSAAAPEVSAARCQSIAIDVNASIFGDRSLAISKSLQTTIRRWIAKTRQ